MDQLDKIKKILNKDFIVDAEILEERNKDNFGKDFLMTRKIEGHTAIKYILFRLDPDKVKPFPYFNTDSGLSKICDYIMFVQKKNTLYILLIELKLGSDGAYKQLKSSEEFAKFIINSGNRIGLTFTDDLHFRKVKISEIALSRPKTANEICKKDQNEIIHYNHKSNFKIMEILHLD